MNESARCRGAARSNTWSSKSSTTSSMSSQPSGGFLFFNRRRYAICPQNARRLACGWLSPRSVRQIAATADWRLALRMLWRGCKGLATADTNSALRMILACETSGVRPLPAMQRGQCWAMQGYAGWREGGEETWEGVGCEFRSCNVLAYSNWGNAVVSDTGTPPLSRLTLCHTCPARAGYVPSSSFRSAKLADCSAPTAETTMILRLLQL